MADYPLPNFHFMVEWGGARIGFTRVRNLAMSNSPMAIRHGASPEYSNANAPT
ncbi:MAG: phage tail protein, partial [Saprospiraceae bacterium]|nr:phage tail protein [Saprospiraceae bacterium]